jgi:periplasmic protein CpxP/Spy
MKLVVIMTLAAALSAGTALAQNEQRQGNPAVKSPQPNSDQSSSRGAAGGDVGSARLEPGSNSFTESQARSKIKQAGYQNVTDLRKDDQGIWHAKAQKGGQTVSVGLDFKGNVATR